MRVSPSCMGIDGGGATGIEEGAGGATGGHGWEGCCAAAAGLGPYMPSKMAPSTTRPEAKKKMPMAALSLSSRKTAIPSTPETTSDAWRIG